MKALSPAHAATALALSLAASVTTAQGMTTTTTTARPSSSVTTTGTTASGTAAAGTTASGTTFSATPALNNSTARLQSAPPDASGTNSTTANAADGSVSVTTTTTPLSTNTGGTPSQATFGRDTSFGNDSGNAALGTSPGQTSSGTQAGNSGIGIAAGSDTLQGNGTATTGTPAVTTLGGAGTLGRNAVIVPETGMAGGSVAVNVNPGATTAPIVSRTPTPVFDEAARRGLAQVQREARSGHVFGQAPRTDNDRTGQMPDDPIIRY